MLWKTHLGKSNQFCDDGIADEISYLIVVHYCWLSQLTQLNFLSMTVWNKKFTNIFRNVFSLLHLAASSSDTFKYQSIPKQTQMPVFSRKRNWFMALSIGRGGFLWTAIFSIEHDECCFIIITGKKIVINTVHSMLYLERLEGIFFILLSVIHETRSVMSNSS